MTSLVHFPIIHSSSFDLARDFEMEHFMSFFLFFMTFFALIIKLAYGSLLVNLKTETKAKICFIVGLIGYLLLIVADFYSKQHWWFWIAVLGACLEGLFGALLQTTVTGFLKSFPHMCVGDLVSG
jgi:uncharacterized YccA/Bax inhibitor family protein